MFCPVFNFQHPRIRDNHKQIREMSEYQVEYMDVVGASVEHAKSIAYKKFLETDCTHFFNVDADIFFFYEGISPIDILINQDKEIIGGLYVYKKQPILPSHRPLELQEIYEENGKFPENYKFIIPEDLHEVRWLAGGCIMIKREVIEKLMKEFLVPNIPMVYKNEYLSEDFSFCERARNLGYKIYADPTINLGHEGTYFFTLKDYYKNINK